MSEPQQSTMSTTARLRYIKWDDKFLTEKPYHLYMDPPPGLPVSNYSIIPGPLETIHDLRGRESDFNLDDNGFIVVRQPFPPPNSNWSPSSGAAPDETFINNEYLPSLESLLRNTLGYPDAASCEIIWFDWRARSSDDTKRKVPAGTKWYLDDRSVELAPVQTVHVDQSPASAIKRVRKLVGDRADELLATRRVRLLNIWRPYNAGPVECHPLAICDGSTVPAEKLVAADAVRRSYVGEAYYLVEHEGYRWYFLSRQKKEEVLIFKMYDSDESVKAKCVPHVSFEQDTGGRGDEKPAPRESIEARALVFTPL